MTNGTSNLTAGEHRTGGRLFASDIDWWTVGIYLLMVLFGWLNIYAAVYNEEQANIFDHVYAVMPLFGLKAFEYAGTLVPEQ